jgi:hypothetical protein
MSNIKRYTITIPFAGYFNHTVEAESEYEALEMVHEVIGNHRMVPDKDSEEADMIEWDVYEELSRGNVNFVSVSKQKVEIEDIEDEEQ